MKKIYLFIFSKLLTSASIAYASPECMTCNRSIKDPKADYKEERYANCACPCEKYKRLPQGKCSRCEHRRYPRNWIIMSGDELDTAEIKQPIIAPGKKTLYKVFSKYTEPHPER